MSTQTFDILIIGGGVHGASLAFHLSARGVKVAVLEKSHIAAGATGRSSASASRHGALVKGRPRRIPADGHGEE